MARSISSLNELEKALVEAGQRPVILDFHATWCGPCKGIADDLRRFEAMYPNIILLKVDIDQAADVAEKYDISSVPTFKLIVDGRETDTVIGANCQQIEELFRKHETLSFGTASSASNDIYVIKEVYENGDSTEYFEHQLDSALEAEIQTIVIEPTRLGIDTSRWISMGNYLHRVSVLSGFGCLATGLVWPDCDRVFVPFGAVSLVCAAVYTVSWQFDSCSNYQVERNASRLQTLLHASSTAPIVLVRRVHYRSRLLRAFTAIGSSALCGWSFYRWYFL